MYYLFVIGRMVVGIGMGIFLAIAPPLIVSMFSQQERSKTLMIYSVVGPVGGGFGYIISSSMCRWTGNWKLGLVPSLGIGIDANVFNALFTKDNSGETGLKSGQSLKEVINSVWYSIQTIFASRAYIMAALGQVCFLFVSGPLSLWGNTFFWMAEMVKADGVTTDSDDNEIKQRAATIIGVGVLGGLGGVATGSFLSMCLKRGKDCFARLKTERGDAIACAIGMAIWVIAFFGVLGTIGWSLPLAYLLLFVASFGMSFQWSTSLDLVMGVTPSSSWSTALSMVFMLSHVLGDVPSPVIVGAVSDYFRRTSDKSLEEMEQKFQALRKAFYLLAIAGTASSIFYALSAVFYQPRQEDSEKLQRSEQDSQNKKNIDCIVLSRRMSLK